ncbi:MAG: sigma-70 family RNA polymerase sigma factor [Acidobacteriota bacterium]|nr:sigma-70 family RNA polymerase sigma factor [Acidobacteriota bacterium]MDQ7087544.1 sigma-70 family RNA polymerase sigma factor [Acidobacteriota bacterium]
MSQVPDDRQILERLRNDEPGAFDLFVDRFGDRIYGFGLRMCGEVEDARDVFQETLLQAYQKIGQLKHPEALKSWLYRVASNACLMKRRKGKFEPRRELSLDELMPSGREGLRVEIPDPGRLPDEEAASGELRELLREAIAELPEHYRIVLVLRDMEQLSTREVAEALDLAETAVKMRLHRARLMVRQRLEELLARRVGKGEA